MTPLFPPADQPVEIKQGQGGDCYLLSSLECLLNSDPASRAQIQAMFKPNPNGNGVVLRLKPNLLKPQTDKLASRADYEKPGYGSAAQDWKKYGYEVDPDTGEHVFYISAKRLQEIDNKQGGVQSNSLAVNILERISAYYYVGNWNPLQNLASVVAHNIANRHDTTSTKFVGALLGFKTHDYPGTHFERILKLQELDPMQAVYISMAYGEKDPFGKIHGRHALRLKSGEKVWDNAKGKHIYRLSLINPWDNKKVETVELSEAEFSAAVSSKGESARNVRFCVYSTDTDAHELKMMLAECPKGQGEYVLKNSELYNKLLQKQKTGSLSLYELGILIEQHQLSKVPARKAHEIQPPQKLDLEILKNQLLINPYDEVLASTLREQFELMSKKVDAEFMRQNVLGSAAYNNWKRAGGVGNIGTEQNKINSALASYYFLGKYADHLLTRTMQLRFYLTKDIFPYSEIDKLFTPREFALLTLTNCMNEGSLAILLESSSQNSLKEYLAGIDLKLVDDAFVSELMTKVNIKDLGGLNSTFATIQSVNPLLAQAIKEEGCSLIEQSGRKALEPISNFSFSFRDLSSVDAIRTQKNSLILQLIKMANTPELKTADDNLRLLGKYSVVEQKLAEINKQAELQEERVLVREERLRILQAINFTSRLQTINDMKIRLADNVKSYPNYNAAAERAQTLYINLFNAHKRFLDDPNVTLASFKQDTVDEVKGAMTILNVHRGWKQVLESIANAILSLAEGLGLKSKNSTWGIFEVKTDSRKTAEEFIESVNKLGNP